VSSEASGLDAVFPGGTALSRALQFTGIEEML